MDAELYEHFGRLSIRIEDLNHKLDQILQLLKDNSDTTTEDATRYSTKIAHMLASEGYPGAEDFLRSVYAYIQKHQRVTRRQMRAVDRITPTSTPSSVFMEENW